MCPGQREEARDVGRVVLSVRIDLQHMGVALAARLPESGQHRAALALVHRQPQQPHTRCMQRRQPVQFARAGDARTIVHQQA